MDNLNKEIRHITVEANTYDLSGLINNGDQLIVKGKIDDKGILKADYITNQKTNSIIKANTSSWDNFTQRILPRLLIAFVIVFFIIVLTAITLPLNPFREEITNWYEDITAQLLL